MTPSELKYHYQENNPAGHFFDRETMRFFGDKMANFGCRDGGEFWVLYRKKPQKHQRVEVARFDKLTFKIVRV